MLGHRSIKTTQHNARIVDKKVIEDMGTLRVKFDKKNNIPPINLFAVYFFE
jgi:hypothetical protein